jgi:hypothetical protein
MNSRSRSKVLPIDTVNEGARSFQYLRKAKKLYLAPRTDLLFVVPKTQDSNNASQ